MNAINTIEPGTVSHGPGFKTYIAVWVVLLIMTAITVAAAELHLGGAAIVICLAIAAFKSLLVLLYFMHLRYEKRLIVKLVPPIAIVTLTIFIGLTFSDIFTR